MPDHRSEPAAVTGRTARAIALTAAGVLSVVAWMVSFGMMTSCTNDANCGPVCPACAHIEPNLIRVLVTIWAIALGAVAASSTANPRVRSGVAVVVVAVVGGALLTWA